MNVHYLGELLQRMYWKICCFYTRILRNGFPFHFHICWKQKLSGRSHTTTFYIRILRLSFISLHCNTLRTCRLTFVSYITSGIGKRVYNKRWLGYYFSFNTHFRFQYHQQLVLTSIIFLASISNSLFLLGNFFAFFFCSCGMVWLLRH